MCDFDPKVEIMEPMVLDQPPNNVPICVHDNLPFETIPIEIIEDVPRNNLFSRDGGMLLRQPIYDRYYAIASQMPRQVQRDWLQLFREGAWAVFPSARTQPRRWNYYKRMTRAVRDMDDDSEGVITVRTYDEVFRFPVWGLSTALYVMTWMHWPRHPKLAPFREAVPRVGNVPTFPCEPNDTIHGQNAQPTLPVVQPVATHPQLQSQEIASDPFLERELNGIASNYGRPDVPGRLGRFVRDVIEIVRVRYRYEASNDIVESFTQDFVRSHATSSSPDTPPRYRSFYSGLIGMLGGLAAFEAPFATEEEVGNLRQVVTRIEGELRVSQQQVNGGGEEVNAEDRGVQTQRDRPPRTTAARRCAAVATEASGNVRPANRYVEGPRRVARR